MDHTVEHEDAHRELIKDELKRLSNVANIPNAVVAAGANPTKAEYDVLVGKFNSVLTILLNAGLMPAP